MARPSPFFHPVKSFFGKNHAAAIRLIAEQEQCGEVVALVSRTFSVRWLDKLALALKPLKLSPVVLERTFPEADVFSVSETIRRIKGAVSKGKRALFVSAGGGSTLDAAKLATCLAFSKSPDKILAQAFEKGVLPARKFPLVCMPTTSGSGSEMTSASVIYLPEKGLKKSIHHPRLYPEYAVVDPELCFTMPREVAFASGLDALTHAIESYAGKRQNPAASALALQAIVSTSSSLKEAVNGGRKAREAMHYAASLAGIAISQTGCGIVHALANPLGALTKKPHGIINSVLLPYAVEANAKRSNKAKKRYLEICRALFPNNKRMNTENAWLLLASFLRKISKDLNMPSDLAQLGFTENHICFAASNCYSGSYFNNTPMLSRPEIKALLKKALEGREIRRGE